MYKRGVLNSAILPRSKMAQELQTALNNFAAGEALLEIQQLQDNEGMGGHIFEYGALIFRLYKQCNTDEFQQFPEQTHRGL